MGHHQFFRLTQQNRHFKLEPGRVIAIIDRAVEEKDMVTIEFMLKTIQEDMVPHLFGELKWDTNGYSGLEFLNGNLFLDKIINLVGSS